MILIYKKKNYFLIFIEKQFLQNYLQQIISTLFPLFTKKENNFLFNFIKKNFFFNIFIFGLFKKRGFFFLIKKNFASYYNLIKKMISNLYKTIGKKKYLCLVKKKKKGFSIL